MTTIIWCGAMKPVEYATHRPIRGLERAIVVNIDTTIERQGISVKGSKHLVVLHHDDGRVTQHWPEGVGHIAMSEIALRLKEEDTKAHG